MMVWEYIPQIGGLLVRYTQPRLARFKDDSGMTASERTIFPCRTVRLSLGDRSKKLEYYPVTIPLGITYTNTLSDIV